MSEINHLINAELAENWKLFRDVNGLAGRNATLDQIMIFSANDLIYLLPLLAALLWLLVARWSPYQRWMRARFDAPMAGHARWIAQRATLSAALATGLAIVLAYVTGLAIFEPRPFISSPSTVHKLIAHAADDSFPSDHETVAVAIACALLIAALWLLWASVREPLVGQAAGWGWGRAFALTALPSLIALIALLAAALIGFARVYSGVHYPHDILGGALCGLIGALMARLLAGPLDALYRLITRIAEALRLA